GQLDGLTVGLRAVVRLRSDGRDDEAGARHEQRDGPRPVPELLRANRRACLIVPHWCSLSQGLAASPRPDGFAPFPACANDFRLIKSFCQIKWSCRIWTRIRTTWLAGLEGSGRNF